jgi:hypothetical protein
LQAALIFARWDWRQASTRIVSGSAGAQNLCASGPQAARSSGVPCAMGNGGNGDGTCAGAGVEHAVRATIRRLTLPSIGPLAVINAVKDMSACRAFRCPTPARRFTTAGLQPADATIIRSGEPMPPKRTVGERRRFGVNQCARARSKSSGRNRGAPQHHTAAVAGRSPRSQRVVRGALIFVFVAISVSAHCVGPVDDAPSSSLH